MRGRTRWEREVAAMTMCGGGFRYSAARLSKLMREENHYKTTMMTATVSAPSDRTAMAWASGKEAVREMKRRNGKGVRSAAKPGVPCQRPQCAARSLSTFFLDDNLSPLLPPSLRPSAAVSGGVLCDVLPRQPRRLVPAVLHRGLPLPRSPPLVPPAMPVTLQAT